jgi:hypothetical protein
MLQRRDFGAGAGLGAASGKAFRPKLYRAGCRFSNGARLCSAFQSQSTSVSYPRQSQPHFASDRSQAPGKMWPAPASHSAGRESPLLTA